MRVFLRNKKTRLYRTALAGWASALEEARGFTSVSQATRFALDERLPEVEIVLKCDALPEEVVLPVLPEYCDYVPSGLAANANANPVAAPPLYQGRFPMPVPGIAASLPHAEAA